LAKTDIFRIIAVAVVVAAGLTGCGGERDKGVQSSLNHTEQDTIVRDTIHQNTIDIEEARSDFSQLGSEIGTDTALENRAEDIETAEDELQEHQTEEFLDIAEICALPAGTSVEIGMLPEESIDALFYASEITEEVFTRINGCSYQENDNISLDELSYVRVLHRGFDGTTRIGELIVNSALKEDIIDIMRELYKADYPIEQMVLIDVYGGDDNQSMAANNTSAFNYRTVSGTNKLSNHSYGRAIDINPLYNPYIRTASDGSTLCEPENGAPYINRDEDFTYKIDHSDRCYQLFKEHGFTWGGDWRSVKDYQHFEKKE
jgi:hypothetical protein